ncbi:cell division topological specificity factor MinE [Sulfurimonas sp. RIFOXYB12_FULL_35_9]|jgi:cell division topological specificity factor|uniref:cell division topological specificity factor MinE n=1 Tax=Sulfurimonas sp. RIFOXYB12_FULL_35_9 TaxID=1802256 RepID=UPI0008D52C5F|nr:cell division topological specificity factor MinE [Sulfurimonas sp. RIFOXYB12_FULL_35_9]OHE04460.1 MAG: cell division topological specificity factor MinE [Sulfurimonas sp. RIFOXYB12_FULL_35_9]
MSFFSLFNKKEKSAGVAKDRLRIAISSDRSNTSYPFMAEMKADIIEVVRKYTQAQSVHITRESDGDVDTLGIEIIIPR